MRLPAQLAPKPCARSREQADDAGTIGPDDGDDERGRPWRSLPRSAKRSLRIIGASRREALVLRERPATRRARARGARPASSRRRPIGASARSHSSRADLALGDEAPVLRGDRARVPAVGQVIDRSAGDRIALEDRPLDRGDAAMARQQRRVIADAAQARARERLVAHARVRVRGDDEVGALRRSPRRERSSDSSSTCTGMPAACAASASRSSAAGATTRAMSKPPVLAQCLEHRGAEIARSHQCAFHRHFFFSPDCVAEAGAA